MSSSSSKKRNIENISSSSSNSYSLSPSTTISELEVGRCLHNVKGVIKRNGIWKMRSLQGKTNVKKN